MAPAEVIQAIDNALTLPANEALAAERETFLRLRAGEQSGALRHTFFAERSVSEIPTKEGATARPFETIGVIGGGTMGAGIASACLLAGLGVRLIKRDDAACTAALDRVRGVLDGSRQRGLLSEDGVGSQLGSDTL
ncbi:MAG: 3-hydroxyacyl-CoA dehydrogenase NAD-binding domain-containing protein [Pseudolabrys sp.]